MKKLLIRIGSISFGIIVFILVMSFTFFHQEPDYRKVDLSDFKSVSLTDITTNNQKYGMFKSNITFIKTPEFATQKAFYGQVIHVENNPMLDKIFIGVTSNLISRIELWNDHQMIGIKEVGFLDKMTWGDQQEMSVEFYDQSNQRYPDKSVIKLRFYSGNGFFGDIGMIIHDLSDYGDLSVKKSIGIFSKSLTEKELEHLPLFSNLRVWNNYNSYD